jgi:hypothetical protein
MGMRERVERRADELRKGDRLDIGGALWTVTKAKVKGKTVRLAVESSRGSFAREVKARTRYGVVVDARRGVPTEERARKKAPGTGSPARMQAPAQGPLLDERGAMTRWAEATDLEPPADLPAKRTSPWPAVAAEDADLVEELGARLVGVEVEGGKLLVPPVSDATILGHLLTMHGRRFDGATMAEAKAWAREHDAAGTRTAAQVLAALDLEQAYALHDELHKDLTAMPTPHWHRPRAPR